MPAKKLSKAYPEDVVRRGYLELLDRRGYFVASPQDLTESIAEIFEVGPGFDLYDLSETLAFRLPELARFRKGASA